MAPTTPTPPDRLDKALAFVGSTVDAKTVVEAADTATAIGFVCALPSFVLAPQPFRLPATLAVVGVTLALAHSIRRGAFWLAAAERTTALGAAPALVGRAVLRMQVEPTTETAAWFAARTGRGQLADSLREHVRRAAGTPASGLDAFAAEWEDWQPSLRRSVSLIEAAADAPRGERSRTLDRALAAILDGTRGRMAEFANSIRGPATAIYAFGVLLPLALVAVFPAARVAGVPITIGVIVVIYDVLLPAALAAAGGWLLARRPVAFPPATVDRDHPAVPNRRWPAIAVAITVGIGTWILLPFVLPAWMRWPATPGYGVAAALVAWYRPIAAVRTHVRDVESGLPDALYLVGRRVQEGEAVETAVAHATDHLSGATGDVFADAERIQRQLRAGVHEAFLSDYGALADVPSPRTHSATELLSIAAREGRPAGHAVVEMAAHLEDLQSVEREAKRELAQVTDTLWNTAVAFGPLVGGATIALADGMATPNAFGADTSSFATSDLGIAVGVYVLLLSSVLAALSVGLARGFDRALVGYRVSIALFAGTTTYLVSYAAAATLV